MDSNPPPSQQQQQQQQPPPLPPQQQRQTLRSPPPPQQSGSQLPFEEIAKLFSVPIAEAASILGVCTSVLKRRCRENGVVKWPYRKVHAGKSVEDVKKDDATEREVSRLGRMNSSASMSSTFCAVVVLWQLVHLHQTARSATHRQDITTNQFPVNSKFSSHVLYQQGSKLVQTERTNVIQSTHSRNIPNFFDEFKNGFPANGLSSASNKWWGTGSDEGKSNASKRETDPADKEQCTALDEKFDSKSEDSGILSQPAARLASLRKQAAKDGCEALKLGVSRGYGSYKLSKREKLVLLQVFQSSLPSQWKDSFP